MHAHVVTLKSIAALMRFYDHTTIMFSPILQELVQTARKIGKHLSLGG